MSMLRTTMKNLVSRPATRLYPAVPAEIPRTDRGRIVYDMSKCIFCGLCEKRCPTHAIIMDKANKRQSVSRAKCIACGVCIDSCPTDTIEMRPEYSPPSLAPEIHVYDAKLTPHQFVVASLPPFERAKTPRPAQMLIEEPAPAAQVPVTEELIGLSSPATCAMTRRVLTVFIEDSVKRAVQVMVANKLDGLPVVDINMQVLGIITAKDIARDAGRGKEGILSLLFTRGEAKKTDQDQEQRLKRTLEKAVSEIMTTPVITAVEGTPLREIAALMDTNRISRVPVVDSSGRLCGIITHGDILKAISQRIM